MMLSTVLISRSVATISGTNINPLLLTTEKYPLSTKASAEIKEQISTIKLNTKGPLLQTIQFKTSFPMIPYSHANIKKNMN